MSSVEKLPALDNTMGALFLGVMLAMGLWGASTIQVYYYFDQYPKDSWKLKALVATVWTLDTVHQGLITASAYGYLITNYANPAALAVVNRALMTMIMFNAIISGIVQAFFVLRVWRMSQQNYILTGILTIFSLGQCLSIMAYYIKAYHLTFFAQLSNLFVLEKVLNVFGVVSDFSIAGSLIYLLHRSRTGFKRSETMVNRLILFTINTGMVTSLCAILAIIFVTVFPNTFLYITFYLLISRMYTNSLMATLNARASIRGRGGSSSEETALASINLSRIRGYKGETERTAYSNSQDPRQLSIRIDTEMTRDGDETSKGGDENLTEPESSVSDMKKPYPASEVTMA